MIETFHFSRHLSLNYGHRSGNRREYYSQYTTFNPFLKTSPFVEKGRKLRIICFSGAANKHAKCANLQKIHNINSLKERAFKWTGYKHVYNKVYEAIDWEKKSEFYALMLCKGLFCKDSFLMSQTVKPHCTNEV